MRCLPSTQKKSFHSSLKDRSDLDCYDREKYTRESLLLEQKGGTVIYTDSLEGLDLTGIKYLNFEQRFNQPIEGLDLKEVISLIFNYYSPFNQPVEGLDLKRVETLTFGHLFNQKVEGLDLKGVTSLEFGSDFNQPIEGLDLKGVKSLKFGWYFNQPVEGLDLKGVETLTFGSSFNQRVDGLDLKEVKSLTFGDYYNRPIEGLDLKEIEFLTFGWDFNQPLSVGFLKEGLRRLAFGPRFRQEISPGVFPSSLEILESSDFFTDHPQKFSLQYGEWKRFRRDPPRLIWSPVNANYRLDLERFCGDLDRFHIVNIRHILDYFGIAYRKTDPRETLCNRLRETISPYLGEEALLTDSDLESCDNREDPILFEPLEGHPRSGLVRLECRDSRGERLPDSCFLKDSLRRALMADERCYLDGRFNYDRCLDPLNRQPIPAEILDQIFSSKMDSLRRRYANNDI